MNTKLNSLKTQLEGEFHYDYMMKALYATDASVYRELPLAVALPKNIHDIKLLIDFAQENKISLIPRAAGTSLAGQCVGKGIVVDISKYFNQILEINTNENWVRVQPGVVRDELNVFLAAYGMFFGPNTSTANRCMIGGMVGNNSSGTTSIQYGVTRDKVYNLSSAKKQSIVSYFSANPNGEAEIVSVILRQSTKLKKFKWDVNFSDYIIKGRSSRGNIVTKHSVNKIELKEKGVSTLKPRKIWFDDSVQRLNVDGRGELLGEFSGEDKLLIIRQNGILKTISPEITTRFTDDMIVLEKWLPKKPISAVYFDGKKEKYFLKRFLIENENKEETFISLNKNTFLEIVCTDWKPVIELVYNKERNKEQRSNTSIDIEEFISIKGIKAQGNQLTGYKVKQINILESKEYVPPIEVSANEIEVIDENEIIEEVKDSSENDTDKGQTTLF